MLGLNLGFNFANINFVKFDDCYSLYGNSFNNFILVKNSNFCCLLNYLNSFGIYGLHKDYLDSVNFYVIESLLNLDVTFIIVIQFKINLFFEFESFKPVALLKILLESFLLFIIFHLQDLKLFLFKVKDWF